LIFFIFIIKTTNKMPRRRTRNFQ